MPASARRARIGGVSVAEINELEVRDAPRATRTQAHLANKREILSAPNSVFSSDALRISRRHTQKREPMTDMADRLKGAHTP